ncbi:UDP-N-acetylmuramate dehydrogenase [Helicobacter sp. 11S03491-1]|uniref:UDP-N-acetylmuramate dehydrogenase n=1 Tax=Helicobacter sp. 11S03491-1 TaxID=1476196 RepID=UPI000BA500EA|nr:UDP-N-acetylmuramate dehydrogenase [Helicobacter sp. 11S03491-1]PAF42577.1 UDP-N-acetylenolpyruvoylglucosamine reductase [Helicobacter sp. 11S03491-1]
MTINIDFSKYSSIKVGAKLPIKVIKDFEDIEDGLKIIGYANNLLVSPHARSLAVLDNCYDYIQESKDYVEVGGATSSHKIYRYFKESNFCGLEFLRALPGSLGGLIKMNAGMKEYEIKDILDSACIDGAWIEADDLGMEYRSTKIDGIIFAARFKKIKGFRNELLEIFETMRFWHPKKPSCGSCFKNPKGNFAGKLLESVGLRGYSNGNIGFSKEHANFLINLGGGSFEQAFDLIEIGKKRVFEEYGILLEEEVVIVE